jgi:thymidylate synthase (FAD)
MKTQLISANIQPCKTMAVTARCCYSESNPLNDRLFNLGYNEGQYWEWLVNACLSKAHYSPLEYCQLTFLCTHIPMPTVVQLRTHRGLSMQVQSMRYTSKRICNLAISTDSIFYTRQQTSPDRQGLDEIIPKQLQNDIFNSARYAYKGLIEKGVPPEIARDILPSCYTQNFVLSCNLRELFHIFSMRTPKNAQLEIRQLMYLLSEESLKAVPEAIAWYKAKYWGKAHLSF